MAKEMAKSYKPSEFEDKIYDFWLKGNYFQQNPISPLNLRTKFTTSGSREIISMPKRIPINNRTLS